MQREEFQIYVRILERMLAADWISQYRIKSDEGVQINWTDKGRKCGRLLKRLVKGFQLGTSPAHAIRFDILCTNSLRQRSFSGAVDSEIARFWRDCLDELHLTRDEIDFMCLLHGIEEFGPEDDEHEPHQGSKRLVR